MKEKKTTAKTQETAYEIKTGNYSYKGLFVGLNKKGGLYVGLNCADDTKHFAGGFEAIAILNDILNEFDGITIEYSKEVAKSGNPYESAKVVDYKI